MTGLMNDRKEYDVFKVYYITFIISRAFFVIIEINIDNELI